MLVAAQPPGLWYQGKQDRGLPYSLSGELTLHQNAEADTIVEKMLRDLTEPLNHSSPLSLDLSKRSPLIIEKNSRISSIDFFPQFPIMNLDAENNFVSEQYNQKTTVCIASTPFKKIK